MMNGEKGFTLVEVMVVVVILGLIGAFFYSGVSTGVLVSQRGKDKVEAVSILRAATDELISSSMKTHVGKGDIAYAKDWIPQGYSVTYNASSTGHGVYRLKVEVSKGDRVLAANTALVPN